MNQSMIAGVGNVYRSEVLHLLKIGKRYNRIIVADPKQVGKPRSRMNRDDRLLVYKRDFCTRCETPIESWKLAARTVFACPMCQVID
jgi:endonuclease VIII